MPSPTTIANQALLQLGLSPISGLDERSKEAQYVLAVYDDLLRATLRDFAPSFAERQEALALMADTRNGWSFMYGYPAQCIEARAVYNPIACVTASYGGEESLVAADEKIPYKIGLDSTGVRKVILTNQEAAELIYTAYVDDANVYDTLFVSAFALNLAAHLAIPLKKDKALRQVLMQEYLSAKSSALAKDANESGKARDDRSSFTRSRE